jgi:SpoVK/Ycf46/Vps4 family AAA+-type ATPase
MNSNGMLGSDVDIEELAKWTTGFTEAELQALMRAATSFACKAYIKHEFRLEFDEEGARGVIVSRADFMRALKYDFGRDVGEIDNGGQDAIGNENEGNTGNNY